MKEKANARDEGAPEYVTTTSPTGPLPPTIKSPDDAVAAVVEILQLEDPRERFVALYLNSRHAIIGEPYVISLGSLNASIVHPREVFRIAIERSAASIILAHNHPSGDPTPSEEDLAITRRLQEGGALLGISLVDHVVVGSRDHWVSMRERRLIRG